MITTLLLASLITTDQPAAANASPIFAFTDDLQTSDAFAPSSAEVHVTDDGVWIKAFDQTGALVGDLQMMFADDHVEIDTTFWKGTMADGHVWMKLVSLDPASADFPGEWRTDFDDPAVATARVSTMLSFVPRMPPDAPMPIGKRRCMLYFAGVAMTCGLPVVFPVTGPAAVGAVWACAWAAFQTICECEQYLSIDICPE
jgi:hypothetical protein